MRSSVNRKWSSVHRKSWSGCPDSMTKNLTILPPFAVVAKHYTNCVKRWGLSSRTCGRIVVGKCSSFLPGFLLFVVTWSPVFDAPRFPVPLPLRLVLRDTYLECQGWCHSVNLQALGIRKTSCERGGSLLHVIFGLNRNSDIRIKERERESEREKQRQKQR